ncbi:8984_t:CDS:1 [Funneliformis geosporum]|nr:8984_t:CDS:1 [Funneliformis geosporum]
MSLKNPDCLEVIFENLKDEVTTLHSCHLVNRLWCRLTTPILWRNPLKFTSGRTNATYQVIQIYISCLSEPKRKIIEATIPKLFISEKPLFDYPKHLQEFNEKEFEIGIRIWISMIENEKLIVMHNKGDGSGSKRELCSMRRFKNENFEAQCDLIYDILFELLFKSSKRLRTIRILPMDGCKWKEKGIDGIVKVNYLLYSLQKFIFCCKCKEINSNLDKISNLFTTMSKQVHGLQHLYIDINERSTHLVQHKLFPLVKSISLLIESQNSLKVLIINQFWDCSTCYLIEYALSKQAPSLIYLEINEFSNYNVILQILPLCKNLEIIKFGHPVPLKFDRTFDSTPLPLLTSNNLSIKNFYSLMDNYNHDITLTTTELILRMSNRFLQTLSLSKITETLVKTITKYCSQLTHLSFVFHTREVRSICSLLSSLPSLKHLILIHYDLNQPTNYYLFYQLANSIPNTLNHLGFDFELSPKLLNVFLSHCPHSINILTFHGTKWYREDYLSGIVKYVEKKRNGLKELRIEKFKQSDEAFLPSFFLNALKDAKKIIPVIKDSSSAFVPFFGE